MTSSSSCVVMTSHESRVLVLDECDYLVINARRDVAIEFVASRDSDDDVTDPNQNWIQSPTLHSDSDFSGNSEDDVTYFGFPYDDVTTSSSSPDDDVIEDSSPGYENRGTIIRS